MCVCVVSMQMCERYFNVAGGLGSRASLPMSIFSYTGSSQPAGWHGNTIAVSCRSQEPCVHDHLTVQGVC